MGEALELMTEELACRAFRTARLRGGVCRLVVLVEAEEGRGTGEEEEVVVETEWWEGPP